MRYFLNAVKNPLYALPQKTYAVAASCVLKKNNEKEALDFYDRSLRLDLAHRVLEPMRDVRDRELALGAQAREQPPGRDVRGNRVAHSYLPFCNCWYSGEPANRRRSCVAYEPSATRSPSLRSILSASHSDSAVGSAALL